MLSRLQAEDVPRRMECPPTPAALPALQELDNHCFMWEGAGTPQKTEEEVEVGVWRREGGEVPGSGSHEGFIMARPVQAVEVARGVQSVGVTAGERAPLSPGHREKQHMREEAVELLFKVKHVYSTKSRECPSEDQNQTFCLLTKDTCC